MDGNRLQDLISRGLGVAARQIGTDYDAYRATSPSYPLARTNRYLRLPAAFSNETTSFKRAVAFGQAAWSGIFDTGYTQVGDYLQGQGGTFFIAAQPNLLPTLCILTNRTLSVFRPTIPLEVGPTTYSGVTRTTLLPVLTEWPASVLGGRVGAPGELPGDVGTPLWTILLPCTTVQLMATDLVRDDVGLSYAIASAELTQLGWRITAKQAEV